MVGAWAIVGVMATLIAGLFGIYVSLLGAFPWPDLIVSVPVFIAVLLFVPNALSVWWTARRLGYRLNTPWEAERSKKMLSEWLAELHSPSMDDDQLVVVRASGDEATGLLIAGQFLSWLTSVLSAPSRWGIWYVIPFLAYVYFYAFGPPDLEVASNMLMIVLLGICVVGGSPLFLAASLVMIASWAFGFVDGPFVTMYAFMSAESTPPGRTNVIQLQPLSGSKDGGASGRRGKRRLSHSSLYDDPQVIQHVFRAITVWQEEASNYRPPRQERHAQDGHTSS